LTGLIDAFQIEPNRLRHRFSACARARYPSVSLVIEDHFAAGSLLLQPGGEVDGLAERCRWRPVAELADDGGTGRDARPEGQFQIGGAVSSGDPATS
jgi:hypothetical protein